ncbi:MAG: ABC transporter permease [Filifactoraceae bacterium]
MVKKKRRLGKFFGIVYSFLIYAFLYLPIFVLIIFSFNDSKYRGNWEGFTLRWYTELFRDPSILNSIYTTLFVASVASIISVILGTITAIAIHKLSPRKKVIMTNLSYIPMVNPDIVIGISLLTLFVMLKMKLGFITLILAHITFNVPYVIFAVLPKLQQLDPNLEEAALDLGATPFLAFWKVILPEIMPGIVTGFALAFTMSLDDFIVSFFTTGSGVSTLSIKVYSMTKRGITPTINALSSLMFLAVIAIMTVSQIKNIKQEKQAKQELRLRKEQDKKELEKLNVI